MSTFTIGCEGSVNKDQDCRSPGEEFVHKVPQKGKYDYIVEYVFKRLSTGYKKVVIFMFGSLRI